MMEQFQRYENGTKRLDEKYFTDENKTKRNTKLISFFNSFEAKIRSC